MKKIFILFLSLLFISVDAAKASSTILGTTGTGPQSITIDSAGNIYTANSISNDVTKITPAGVSTVLGTTGSNPRGITIDSAGDIYTANLSSNNVTKITPTASIPSAPVSAPDLQAASDIGTSNTDNITATTTPSFTAFCSAIGNTLTLYSNNPVASTTIGTLTCTRVQGQQQLPPPPLFHSVHTASPSLKATEEEHLFHHLHSLLPLEQGLPLLLSPLPLQVLRCSLRGLPPFPEVLQLQTISSSIVRNPPEPGLHFQTVFQLQQVQ